MSQQIFFTHVMKTGGTTLTQALEAAVGDGPMFPNHSPVAVVAAKSLPDYLMAETAERRAEYALISVHYPAWVTFRAVDNPVRATMLRDPVARTISHLKQIATSTHPAETVAEAWADDEIRRRMTDYMCQLFSDPGEPTPEAVDPNTEDPEVRRAFLRALGNGWSTAIWHPRVVDSAAAAAAIACLDRFDVVGVTDELPAFAAKLSTASGLRIQAPGHANRSLSTEQAEAWLVDEIKAATRHDQALFEHAELLTHR
ncbi:MAG: hypothetical protein ACI9C1_000542 [Candidatus Aldehydirespiratoraceae bacterium]|jgi:hypothetical protein